MGQIRDSGKSPKICWYDLQDGSIEARVNASESGYHGYLFRRQGGSWQLVDTYESITVYLVLFVACAAMHRMTASRPELFRQVY